jgi:two-component system chemotaxis sensor kinase CheA
MNEFLQQFVVESRELVAQAAEGLLQLERAPQDGAGLDAVFRAFHTLKGGAGIVEFAAMEHAVHAAEDVLAEARAGQRSITPALVGACLACLDQVSHWLERIAASGELPAGDDEAQTIVGRFADLNGAARAGSGETDAADWAQSLLLRHGLQGKAFTAVRYTPNADCFFQGEDPAARIAGLPQLLVQELVPVMAWPALSELDPYACNLVLMALSGASADAVRAQMQGCIGSCDIVAASEVKTGPAASNRARDLVRELLLAQQALLAEPAADASLGRVASAGRVAANVLQSASRSEESRQVSEATERSLAEGSVRALTDVLDRLLSTDEMPAVVIQAVPPTRLSESTLRVETSRIDALVRLTGELTTAKNALAHTVAHAAEAPAAVGTALKARLKDFEGLIARLQQAVLALRVLPLRTVLQRFPRVLREISSSLGKPVMLQIDGDHTEADKAIVDMLFEPLLHALRNAIDHGVESPARRLELGKPLVATIHIRARRDADRVIVEVADDGSGVDVARVREVALARQLVSPQTLEALDEAQIIDLIFAPGFSTAATVSEISGRGVGLDAVRTVIQRIGGQVALTSRPGQGTTLTFSLPFSVMVTQVLTVQAGGQTFGIPLDALLETVRVPQHLISGIGSARVVVHRERTLPLIDLGGELGQGTGTDKLGPEVIVALASVSEQVIALRVDQVGERIEVILKPLEGLLAGLRGITGTTLLGNGEVLLVLDLWELLQA